MRLLLLSLLAVVGGCAPTAEKRMYDVTVKNESSKPVTIWLTKDGLPFEPGWKSPEDLAIEQRQFDEKISGVIIPPGKAAGTGNVTGLFFPETQAILRVYLGERKFTELLAMGSPGTDRIDTVLRIGANVLTISDNGPGFKVARASGSAGSPP